MTADSQNRQEAYDGTYVEEDQIPFDEDKFVVADMSNLELQPLLVPRLDILYKRKRGDDPASMNQTQQSHAPEQLDGEGRLAMIRGALAAVFLLVGILAAAFAGLIFLIGALWG